MQKRPNVYNAPFPHKRQRLLRSRLQLCKCRPPPSRSLAPSSVAVDLQIYPILFRPSSHFPDLIPGLCIECKEVRDTARFLRGGLSGADTKNGAITMDLAEPVSILIKVIEVSSSFGLVGSPPLR